MDTLIFVLTLPLKPAMAWLLNRYHWLYVRFHYARLEMPGTYPDVGKLALDRGRIFEVLDHHLLPAKTGCVLNTNPDHQALRHASLIWAARASSFFQPLVEGMENYIGADLKFKRGTERLADAPPEFSISQAFAVACAIEHSNYVPPSYAARYVLAVQAFMENDFTASDSSSRMTVKSTAFDIVAVCSMLYTAALLCPGTSTAKKFLRRARLLILTHGILALEPLTYRPGDRRYFVEHMMMFGAWAAFKSAPTWLERQVFRWILFRTYALSAQFTNPYFAALADECGALTKANRKAVVLAHHAASAWDACIETDVTEARILPMDWSDRRSSEFNFDGAPNGKLYVGPGSVQHSFVPLSGLTLSMSLISLRRDRGWGLD